MPTYDLDETRLARLCTAALAAHPSTGRFAALAIGPADPMADVARTVERQIFEESFGNDATTMSRFRFSYQRVRKPHGSSDWA